jgi:hypothetical protein
VIAYQQQPGEEGLAAPIAAADPGIVTIKESLVCNEYLEDAYPQLAVGDATLSHTLKEQALLTACRLAFVKMRVPQSSIPWPAN